MVRKITPKKAQKASSKPIAKRPSGRRKPPEGFITASEAEELLGNRMLYKYREQGLIERVIPENYTYGFYRLTDVERLRNSFNVKTNKIKTETAFARATIDDMEGVYEVARSLFGSTTSADARKPLIARCPDGNYILRDKEHDNEIVAYVHMQPLKKEVMDLFMHGKIFGKDIRMQDLEPFEEGKPVDVLVKSIGATRKYGEAKSAFYIQALLRGVTRELTKLGAQGIIIRKICATSETLSGIHMANHAGMKLVRTLKRPHDNLPGRYAYELDVATSDLAMLQPYKKALAKWKAQYSTQD